jgi:hypothetical protein
VTTTSNPLVVPGPTDASGGFITTSTTLPATETTGSDDDTGQVVALAVAGLLVVAALLTVLTVWYWRRTRPSRTEPEPDQTEEPAAEAYARSG